MPIWPTALPPHLEVTGYQEQAPRQQIRKPNDAGPPKSRPRFTAGLRPITGQVILTPKTQVEIFDDFYKATLQMGSIPFDWTHPRTGAACVMRFRDKPRKRPISPEAWMVELPLEILPS